MKTKITFTRSIDTDFGGAEIFLKRLCTSLKKQNIDFDIQHSSAPAWLSSWLKAWWFNWQTKLFKGKRFYFSLDRIDSADIYRAGDGVHKAYLATRKKSFNPLHWTYCTLEKHCFNNAKKIIANNPITKQEIIQHYGISPDKIQVIYNGYDPIQINPTQAKLQLAQEFSISADIPIILFVGSGFERKGVSSFLKTIAQLKTPFHAFIVGKEKHMAPYLEQCQKLNLSNKVTFTGLRKDVVNFYAAADVFLYPAVYEPFGNVVLEAMAYETAVFVSRQTGMSALIPEQYTFDTECSYETINSLLENSTALEETKTKFGKMAQQHTMKQTADETLKIIKEVINHAQ